MLLLALTDQFGHSYKLAEIQPKDVIARLSSRIRSRVYYTGIVAERQAKAILDQESVPNSAFLAHDFLTTAMRHYEEAAEIRPPGNDDALSFDGTRACPPDEQRRRASTAWRGGGGVSVGRGQGTSNFNVQHPTFKGKTSNFNVER